MMEVLSKIACTEEKQSPERRCEWWYSFVDGFHIVSLLYNSSVERPSELFSFILVYENFDYLSVRTSHQTDL